jgi:cyclin-dependent kinase 7
MFVHFLKNQITMASKYVKGESLGEGTWGSVFEAIQVQDNVKVAIKRIKPSESKDAHLGLNFTALREVKFLREIKSSFIVDVRHAS